MSALPAKTRQQVWERCDGRCERCGRPGTNVHHRRPRGMGGTSDPNIHDPANLVVLCGSGTTGCHGWVESHRERAIEQGWLVPRRDPRQPGDVPVFAEGQWWLIGPSRWARCDTFDVPF